MSPSARSLSSRRNRPRVEAAHHHVAAAGMEGRVGVDVQPAGVEGRQEHQVLRLRRQADRHGALDAVEHAHLVGDLRTLGPPGRARRVHDGPDVGEIERRRIERAVRRSEPRLVGAGLAVGEVGGVRHARQPRHLERRIGELHAVDQHHGARILGDELELGHREPPVQRQEDRAQPPAGELQLEDVGVVHAEHRDAIAVADAEGVAQPQCRARHALVELGVGEAPAGRQIVRRLRPRREARVMGDPVLHGNTRRHCVSSALHRAELPTGAGFVHRGTRCRLHVKSPRGGTSRSGGSGGPRPCFASKKQKEVAGLTAGSVKG